jgi:hypothetical protein
MSWKEQINGDPLPWLLDPELPGVRYLALRDLLELPEDDPELSAARRTAHKEGPIAAILANMDDPGYWVKPGPGYNPKYRSGVWSVTLLAQLGGRVREDARIERACQHLIEHALAPGGQFNMSGAPSATIDCLQGNLCWALMEMGFNDPRLASAYEWMARSVTGEGIAPLEDKAAPVRYYAYKCGPSFACGANYGLPCAWGGAKVMLAFSQWPADLQTPVIENAIQHGVDFLFSTDPAIADYPSGGTGKPSGNWRKFGFPVFYVTDILQIVEALVKLGYGHDPRLVNALRLIKDKQDSQGRWLLEYDYSGKTWVDFGEKKQPNKWVTLRALRVLKAVG